ncbi:YncE family protein [Hymenobacter bucti]|uniref:YncE family protein n=1 Tax=Hymenobacter bucti TaxID=1844114 RepID=A0ABW4QSE0_9BACT
MSRLLLLLAVLALPQLAFAQRPTDKWYFGRQAGLDFSSGTPTPLTDGAMTTYEGCATATTKRGELLFYTDGQTVWNRQHQPMPGGRRLMGSGSSTQSALIVPDPGSGNIFYIFTVAPQGAPDGLRYSVVDMTRDNGLGDVPRANLLLLTPVAEKLAAVRHPNGRDVWVVAHRWNSNAFIAYLVTADGVAAKPIMSNVGSPNAGPGRNAIGALKFSPDGTKLAAAIWRDSNKFEVYNFDRATGKVSSPRSFGPYPEAYGVEFSPDGTKLYGTCNGNSTIKTASASPETQVWQFDLATKAATLVGQSSNHKIGALQRGPDGKIYVAREDNSFLGVIGSPNAAGKACGYVDDGLKLGGRRSKLGLPAFITEP